MTAKTSGQPHHILAGQARSICRSVLEAIAHCDTPARRTKFSSMLSESDEEPLDAALIASIAELTLIEVETLTKTLPSNCVKVTVDVPVLREQLTVIQVNKEHKALLLDLLHAGARKAMLRTFFPELSAPEYRHLAAACGVPPGKPAHTLADDESAMLYNAWRQLVKTRNLKVDDPLSAEQYLQLHNETQLCINKIYGHIVEWSNETLVKKSFK